MGTSEKCLSLWDTGTGYEFDETVPLAPLYHFNEGDCFYYTPCTHLGSPQLQINWDRATSRRRLKFVNEIFPFSSQSDKTHTILDLASFLAHNKGAKIRLAINETLKLCTLGWPNIIVLSFLVHCAGNPSYPIMTDIYSKYKMFCRSKADFSTTQKAMTVAIRRTARLPDNTPLTVDNVKQLSYFEMATGRARHVSDWVEEKIKRTTGSI